jgi:hypothetical protein
VVAGLPQAGSLLTAVTTPPLPPPQVCCSCGGGGTYAIALEGHGLGP